VIPVAVLFGGFGSAGSLLQRRLDVPDASVMVLQGVAFLLILASDALRGRLFTPADAGAAPVVTAEPAKPVAAPVPAMGESTSTITSPSASPSASTITSPITLAATLAPRQVS